MSIGEAYDANDALGLAALVHRRQVHPDELLDEALARVSARDPALHAVIHRFEHRARRAIDDGLPEGPFTGVPFLLKDLDTHVAGEPSTEGCRFFADRHAETTSEVVERFDRAGLASFGKTNVPEFGLSPTTEPVLHGPTRNPWDHDRSVGGSSGGSAAAVAAGIVPMAHATDGGGSIRIPAAAAGLVGLKPSRGVGPFRSWLSVDNVVSRSVRDSAAALDVLATDRWVDRAAPLPAPGTFLAATLHPPRRLRIGVTTSARDDVATDPACVAAVERTVALLEDLGHHVEERQVPVDWEAFGVVQGTVMGTHVARAVADRAAQLGREPADDELEPLARMQYDRSATQPITDYARAEAAIHKLGRDLDQVHETVDLVLTPTLTEPPPRLGAMTGTLEDLWEWAPALGDFTAFLGVRNSSGQPAISLPLHATEDDLPVGVQFVARFGHEATLLALAGQLEAAAPWWGRRPTPWW